MIRTIYEAEPNFPATDQHPDAKRIKIRNWVVDYIGDKPDQTEVDSMLNPPVKELTLEEKLAKVGITLEDMKALVKGEVNVAVTDAISMAGAGAGTKDAGGGT